MARITPVSLREDGGTALYPNAPTLSSAKEVDICAAITRTVNLAAPMMGRPKMWADTTNAPQAPPVYIQNSLPEGPGPGGSPSGQSESGVAELIAVAIHNTTAPPRNETHAARSGVPTCSVITPLMHACIGKMVPAANASTKYIATLSPSIELAVAPHMVVSASRRHRVGRVFGSTRKPMASHKSEDVSWPRVAASWNVAKPSGEESSKAATT